MDDNKVKNDRYEALKLENQLCFPLYAASRAVVKAYTPLLKPLGLTYTQYIVLMALWENDGQKVGDLCKKLYLDNGTLTPLLKKMERSGLIVRTRAAADERVVMISLTYDGWAMRDKCVDIPKNMACQCRSGMDSKEAKNFYQDLYRLLDALSE
ncbi:MAG: MarR family transcriptional regulator [Eubacteriales bacterium]|nr:MarR family transcriptional regulator [Eubacteriales bacterium]